MNNISGTIYKLSMIVVGCFIAYYLMTLSTNSKKMVHDMSSQAQYPSEMRGLEKKIHELELAIGSIKKDIKSNAEKISTQAEKISTQQKEVKASLGGISKYNKSNKSEDISSKYEALEAKVGKIEKDITQLSSNSSGVSIKKMQGEMSRVAKLVDDNLATTEGAVLKIKNQISGLQKNISTIATATNNKINISIQQNVDNLNQRLESYKELSVKTLSGIEKSLANVEKGSTQTILDTKKWLNSEITALVEKSKNIEVGQAKVQAFVEKYAEQYNVEINQLKSELNGLRDKIETVKSSAVVNRNSEPIGIVVNAHFEKSLVLINTAEGSYVFNPYADFTGIIRVRDAHGSETMLRVPFTGDYLKVSSGVLDSGPFSRNCAQGVNCNLEVRGSLGSTLKAE